MGERAKIDQMAEDLRDPLADILAQIREDLASRHEYSKHRVVLWETWRTHEKQWKQWAKGRAKQADGRWVVTDRRRVRTWARPEECAHCVVGPDGKPASEAADIAIVTPKAWLPDGFLAWALIPAAAFKVSGNGWEMGAAFKSIRGGDWPHIQRRNWRARKRNASVAS